MKNKKRSITLLEIMIVIFLIGLIGSVIGFNMKGSMDKGRAFKTQRAREQILDILELQLSDSGVTVDKLVEDPAKYLKASGMVKNPDALLKDGWGQNFEIIQRKNGIKVYSKKLEAYEKKEGLSPSQK